MDSVLACFVERDFSLLAELLSVDAGVLGADDFSAADSLVFDTVSVAGSLGVSGTFGVLKEWYDLSTLVDELNGLSVGGGLGLGYLRG